MIFTIYKRALSVLMKKPLVLWGISLLEILLLAVATALFGAVPGVALGLCLLLHTAMIMVYLLGYRGEDVHVLHLFDCFRDLATVKRVLGGMLWMILWIFLWSLIPIVGIVFATIRAYEYRLTPYILMTEPEIPATEAIKVSKERTHGYKLKMWGADVLIPLMIFGIVVVLSLLSTMPLLGGLFTLILVVFVICAAALYPLFLGLVQAAFYEEIKNPTIVAPAPQAAQLPLSGVFCPNCGTPLYPDSKFCPNCGHKLDT